MLRIENGRAAFYQWDVDQRLIVEHDDVVEVAFDNSQTSPALVCTVYQESGIRYADVPNILLQQPFTLRAYGWCGECVRAANAFKVIPRERPADYIYTETEVKTLDSLDARVRALEAGGGSGGGSGVGIEDVYVQDDRLHIERTDGITFVSESLRGHTGPRGVPGGYYVPSVSAAGMLEFTPYGDGLPPVLAANVKGPPGADGYTPQKGIDYFDGDPGADGRDGNPGADGRDGISPTVTVNKTGKITTLSFKDVEGEKTVTVDDGDDGEDGYSPTISVRQITGGHRVTVTDKDGTKSFDVADGKNGTSSEGGGGMTDEETLAAMIETDTLPTVHDGNGRVLTDVNNTVIMRY